jgi:hypothetical protein
MQYGVAYRQITHQIIAMVETVLLQNYFIFQHKINQPEQGIAMVSPISGIVAEIFLQNYEDNYIKQFWENENIYYTRYVDDIFIIYDETKTNPQIINTQINKIHNNMEFTPTHEEHNTINYLDLTIRRHHNKLNIDIYRKPTATDTTINFLYKHPIEQKMATFRSYINRIHSLPLNQEDKQKEWKTIQIIAKNNNFPKHMIQKLNWKIQQKATHTQPKDKTRKIWTTFTYHSPKIRKITSLFKNTHIGIAFKATTITQQLRQTTPPNHTPDYEKSGIYKIICNTCHKAYVGQTSCDLKSRFREHTRYIKNNDPRSAYALHILNCRHEYGNIENTMTVLKSINAPNLLLPYEKMYIQKLHSNNELIPEQYPNEPNPMFRLFHVYNIRHNHHDEQ